MLFVDGENLTIRAQKIAAENGIVLAERHSHYVKDYLIWLNSGPGTAQIFQSRNRLLDYAVRAYFYTSVVGDEQFLDAVRNQLRGLGFDPIVFKKDSAQKKTKGVDIALTKDMLSHAFRNNYQTAILVAGDGDYVPLVEEVKRLGKRVYVWFFASEGLNPALRLAADQFFDITGIFINHWKVN